MNNFSIFLVGMSNLTKDINASCNRLIPHSLLLVNAKISYITVVVLFLINKLHLKLINPQLLESCNSKPEVTDTLLKTTSKFV